VSLTSCIGYCPSRRLQGTIQRLYRVEHPWQLSYEQFHDLRDRLTLSEGRTELDRIARALHSDQPLLATLEQYRENLPRIVRLLPHLAPGDAVTIYRSIARDDPHRCIRPGDWIALEPAYARRHGGTTARFLKKRVPVEHVAWAGTSEDEWVYAPCPVPEMSVYEYLLEYGKAT